MAANEKKSLVETITSAPSTFCTYFKGSAVYYKENPLIFKDEFLSGLTVTILQVPESVAFSYVAGVDPICGLYSTFFLGFITAAVGGKEAMISGAAGAMAVVAKDLMSDSGPLKHLDRYGANGRFQHLLFTMFLCSILQMLSGIFRLAQLVRLIPQSAMLGFMNGLAIVIFMAQFTAFQVCPLYDTFQDCREDQRVPMSFADASTWATIVLVAITMAIMVLFPKITVPAKCPLGKVVPASLVALIIGTLLEHLINRPFIGANTRIVRETAPIGGDLPVFNFPLLEDYGEWRTILQYAFSLAMIGLIESVMTLQALDVITRTPPSIAKCNQECFAQGLGNLVCSLFNAMGGDAMIGQSTINAMNGARGRISGMVAGLGMFFAVVVASPVIEIIPVPTLTGVLFMVVIHTFNWSTFRMVWKLRRSDAIGIVLVTVVAVLTDLAIAVGLGVIWQSLVIAWDNGAVSARDYTVTAEGKATKVYVLQHDLFFGAIDEFRKLFSYETDPDDIVLDFRDVKLNDFSAVVAINGVSERYAMINKRVTYQNMSEKNIGRMQKAGYKMEAVTSEPDTTGILRDAQFVIKEESQLEMVEVAPSDEKEEAPLIAKTEGEVADPENVTVNGVE